MYSIRNDRKSVVAERFIRTLKTNIYKYMISISKNVYIDKLDDIVNECNNKYHITIKMKLVDVKHNAYVDFSKEVNDKDQQGFRIEKVIKKKGEKLYVKWKGYDTSFKSWIDKKDLMK